MRFADQEFAGLIAALVSGKIDVIIADMYDTQERRKQIDFSDPRFRAETTSPLPSRPTSWQRARRRLRRSRRPEVSLIVDSVVSSFESNILHERRYLH